MISERARQRMRDLAARYPVARSAVMPALYIAQQEEIYYPGGIAGRRRGNRHDRR